jgi:hypothetical protein
MTLQDLKGMYDEIQSDRDHQTHKQSVKQHSAVFPDAPQALTGPLGHEWGVLEPLQLGLNERS